jgi:hypothetical protein
MKIFATRFIVTAALLFAVPQGFAQYADVTGGSLTIQLSDATTTLLQSHRVAAAAYTPAPYDWQIPFLGVTTGLFHMASGRGAFGVAGQLEMSDGISHLLVVAMEFESLGSRSAVTGSVYVNGKFMARIPILCIQSSNALGAPLQAGQLRVAGIASMWSSAMANTLTRLYQVTVPAEMSGATLMVIVGFAPLANY